MEDILEELVGDIQDEHDEEAIAPVVKIDDRTYEFDGMFLIEDAYDELHLHYDELEESTIGGYVFNLLGQEPNVGDKVEDNCCEFEVLSVDNMRISRVRVVIKACENKDEDTE